MGISSLSHSEWAGGVLGGGGSISPSLQHRGGLTAPLPPHTPPEGRRRVSRSHPRPLTAASAELGGGALCHRLCWKMEAGEAALAHKKGGVLSLASVPRCPPCPSGWLCLAAGTECRDAEQ